MQHIISPNDDNALSSIVSTGHFNRLYTILHPADRVQDCTLCLFENDKERIKNNIRFLYQIRLCIKPLV